MLYSLQIVSLDLLVGHCHPGPDPGSRLWIPAFAGMTEKRPATLSFQDSPS